MRIHGVKVRWQTGELTEKVVQQLRTEPKVYLTPCSPSSSFLHGPGSCTDHNVPDLSDIANYVECSSVENIYYNEVETDFINRLDVEANMSRIFCTDENATSEVKLKPKSKKKVKPCKTKERLLQLFGSHLDDVVLPTPQKLTSNGRRRHTLPVSINKDFLKPVKVRTKRKSEDDKTIGIEPKVRRLEILPSISPTVCTVEFTSAESFIAPESIAETAVDSECTSDLQTAVILSEPAVYNCIHSSVVDLTGDDDGDVEKHREIKGEHGMHPPKEETCAPATCEANNLSAPVNLNLSANVESNPEQVAFSSPTEPCRFSEKANAPTPARAVSMPLLSPVSPSPGTQVEATLPDKFKLPVSTDHAGEVNHPSEAQLARIQPAVMQANSSQRMQIRPAQKTICSNNNLYAAQQNNRCGLQMVNNMQSGQSASFGYSRQQAGPTPQSTSYNQRRGSVGSNVYPLSQVPTTVNTVQAPHLYRIHYSRLTLQHTEITNEACADRAFPHLYLFVQWKHSVFNHLKSMEKCMTPRELQEENVAFVFYANERITSFGKKLLSELATVNVNNLDIRNLLQIIANKFSSNANVSIFKVCIDLYMLLQKCEEPCKTPFTKKFFNSLKAIVERVEQRRMQTAAFTEAQYNQLKMQIHIYSSINTWLKAYFSKSFVSNVSRISQLLRPSPPLATNLTQNLQAAAATAAQQYQYERSKEPNSVTVPVVRNNRHDEIGYRKHTTVQSTTVPQVPENTKLLADFAVTHSQNVHKKNSLVVSRVATVQEHTNNVNTSMGFSPTNSRTPIRATHNLKEASNNINEAASRTIRNVPVPVPVIQCDSGRSRSSPQERVSVSSAIASTDPNIPMVPARSSSVPQLSSVPANSVESASVDDDVIDLTWIDDENETEMFNEIADSKNLIFKVEGGTGDQSASSSREVTSPVDSGLGSPMGHQNDDDFKCLCGNKAIYVCACNSSMYCSRDCQIKDWADHQRLCHQIKG